MLALSTQFLNMQWIHITYNNHIIPLKGCKGELCSGFLMCLPCYIYLCKAAKEQDFHYFASLTILHPSFMSIQTPPPVMYPSQWKNQRFYEQLFFRELRIKEWNTLPSNIIDSSQSFHMSKTFNSYVRTQLQNYFVTLVYKQLIYCNQFV